jgi:protein-L-isoaspartate(D-aspartate) O-methyltransferase
VVAAAAVAEPESVADRGSSLRYRRDVSLEDIRRAYAESVVLGAPRAQIDALIEAFATVPREAFLGPGPWSIGNAPSAYTTTPDASPEHVYRDTVVAIDPVKQLNNGQPSAHAKWILAAAPRRGDALLHVGCGTGYYTAIFAELVGSTGQVIAFDVEVELVARAQASLAPWAHATAMVGDASDPRGTYDVIYVNAGATHARREWLDALRPGGRLVIPLTMHMPQYPQHGVGMVVAIEHVGDRWPVRVVSPVGIYDCVGARDPDAENQIGHMMARARAGERMAATGLVLLRAPHERGPACQLHVDGFCISAAS